MGAMRRVRHYLFTIVWDASLLLCVTTAVLWVRSYWRVDVVAHHDRRLHRTVSGGGGIFLERFDFVVDKGSWRNATVNPMRSTADYALRSAATRGWQWE